jgi:hypothetical protein
LSADWRVFYLNKLSDFSGNQIAGEAGIAIGGGSNLWAARGLRALHG